MTGLIRVRLVMLHLNSTWPIWIKINLAQQILLLGSQWFNLVICVILIGSK